MGSAFSAIACRTGIALLKVGVRDINFIAFTGIAMRAEERKRAIQEGIREAQRGGAHFIQDINDEITYGADFLKEKRAVS